MHDAAEVAFFRRRSNFLGTPPVDPDHHTVSLGDTQPHDRVDAADPLEQAATSLVRSSLESQALSMQMPVGGADMDRMLSAAQHLLRGMPRHQLAGLSPSSSIMQTLTQASFSIGMTADAQQRAMRMAHEKANLASHAAALAEQARTGGAVPFGFQRPGRGQDNSGSSSASESGARFAGLGGERVGIEMARQMQLASHEAIRSGIPWAVSKPELLKLGPSAVKAIADVQIKEPTYQHLTTQAHFAAKDVVTLATFAKTKGIPDANKLAHATADVVQAGETTPEQIKIKTAITGYMAASAAAAANPSDQAAQQKLEQAGMHQRATLTPIAARSADDYQKVQKYEDEAKVEQRFRATAARMEAKADVAVQTANVATTKALADDKRVDAGFDDLAGPAPKSSQRADAPPVSAPASPGPVRQAEVTSTAPTSPEVPAASVQTAEAKAAPTTGAAAAKPEPAAQAADNKQAAPSAPPPTKTAEAAPPPKTASAPPAPKMA